jgi:uncharacterized membrane protein
MPKEFEFLFRYFKKEKIYIDKSEFIFQMESHPDFPSLLSIVDTLNFFNIKNGAITVSIEEIESLPNCFIALLEEDKGKGELCFVEQKRGNYCYLKDKKEILLTKQELESRWKNVVLLVEKSEVEIIKIKNRFFIVIPLLCLITFLAVIFLLETHIKNILFFVFPTIGFLLSILALKDLFGVKSELINNFCSFTDSTSCSTVVDSDKWTIFKFITFSDLSIVFFASQFVGLLAFLLNEKCAIFFSIQEILLFMTIPVVLLSLYFQKFVEKQWCPICLAIIGVTLAELIYLILNNAFSSVIPFKSILLLGFVFFIVVYVWDLLKKGLIARKELKEFQLKANRFIRNYRIFKNILLSKEKVKLPFIPIILGNQQSKTVITVITNPFCSHCKNLHKIIDEVLEKYNKDLQVKILIKVNLDYESDERKEFFRILLNIYFENGGDAFSQALFYWFEKRDIKSWIQKYYYTNMNIIQIDDIYGNLNNWCSINNFHYTPSFFINDFEYPSEYERDYLPYFINELLEDNIF